MGAWGMGSGSVVLGCSITSMGTVAEVLAEGVIPTSHAHQQVDIPRKHGCYAF